MIRTHGNVIVEDIKIGDIHYEYFMGTEMKVKVTSLPVKEERENDNYYTWTAENEEGTEINYGVSDKLPHYGPNLYDYPAYINFNKILRKDE